LLIPVVASMKLPLVKPHRDVGRFAFKLVGQLTGRILASAEE
jgi:hypothetical protein